MNFHKVVLFLVIMTACNRGTESEADVADADDLARPLLTLEQLPPMPDYPRPRNGRLVVVSAGDFAIDGEWEAEAGICATAYEIELYADDDSLGTLLVFYYPDGEPEGSYSIMTADSIEIGERAALIGVQVFQKEEAFGFRGIEGSIELQIAGEGLTGRFTATLKEVEEDVLTLYVGVFSNVALRELPTEYCSRLSHDSLSVEEPSTVRRY